MCKAIKIRSGKPSNQIDKCLRLFIRDINKKTAWKTLASCCGHGIFHPTIVIVLKKTPKKFYSCGYIFELFSNTMLIPIKKKYLTFYVKDKKSGLYYIPIVEARYPKIPLNQTIYTINSFQ
jgi:hypothetical protein